MGGPRPTTLRAYLPYFIEWLTDLSLDVGWMDGRSITLEEIIFLLEYHYCYYYYSGRTLPRILFSHSYKLHC
uniref:Uncharacterized protein n=1 Tax=Picea glauca TaxID=3330 RepID=A0A101M2G3_PICGL|nr:hypothetical protein ABT39_MTgene2916 [Picea glauca]QHR90409.1 hypothetical protein Q903MT_gene4432 [Picea sitchensis]